MKAKIFQVDPENPDNAVIARASDFLQVEGIVSYPTETFYALGTSISSETALERIFTIKGRQKGKPLPVIIPGRDSLKWLCTEIPGVAVRLMEEFWPGGLTLIFRASRSVSPLVTGGTGTIGVRISSHAVAQALVTTLGSPITATSANLAGEEGCSTAQQVAELLGEGIEVILDGGRTEGVFPSTVLDLTQVPPRILREGIIPSDTIRSYVTLSP